MPAKRSINENSGFLGGGKGNGPSMASNILDVLANFIERAGGRIFTQGCFIRQQSGYLISTRTLKKSSSFAADSDISTQSPDISEVRANSVNFLLDFSSLDNSGCVVIFGVPSTIEIDAVNLSVALFPFRSERSARPRHALDARYRPAFRLDLRQPFVNGLSIPPRIHSRTEDRKRLFTGHGVYPRAKARWAMSVRWKAPSKAILSTPA